MIWEMTVDQIWAASKSDVLNREADDLEVGDEIVIRAPTGDRGTTKVRIIDKHESKRVLFVQTVEPSAWWE